MAKFQLNSNQHIGVRQDHVMKQIASRHVKCIKGPSRMWEEESGFEYADDKPCQKLVSPGAL